MFIEVEALVELIKERRCKKHLPEKWIILDTHHYLDKYSDKRYNPIVDVIMHALRQAQIYSQNIIVPPSREEFIIKNKREYIPNYAFEFEITDGDAHAGERENFYNEIIASVARAPALCATDWISEVLSSIQGGDNEGTGPHFESAFLSGYKLTEVDKIWGRFNYGKREPCSALILKMIYNGRMYETIEERVDLNYSY